MSSRATGKKRKELEAAPVAVVRSNEEPNAEPAEQAPEIDEHSFDETVEDFESVALSLLYAPNGSAHMLRHCVNKLVEFRVPSKFICVQQHKKALYGTDIYTDDSDIVAMLAHTGLFPVRLAAPAKLIGLSVFCKVLPAQSFYTGSTRNDVTSKTWPCAYSRASLQIARVEFIERLDLLDPKVSKLRTMATGTSSSGAAVAPAATSSSTNTRLGDALAKLRRKVTGVLTCVNSITNEPWFKYHPSLILDAGAEAESFTSARLRHRETLLFETAPSVALPFVAAASTTSSRACRFEISREAVSLPNGFDAYRIVQLFPFAAPDEEHKPTASPSVVKEQPKKRGRAPKEAAISASPSVVTHAVELVSHAIESALDWSELKWSTDSLTVRGKVFPLHALTFQRQSE